MVSEDPTSSPIERHQGCSGTSCSLRRYRKWVHLCQTWHVSWCSAKYAATTRVSKFDNVHSVTMYMGKRWSSCHIDDRQDSRKCGRIWKQRRYCWTTLLTKASALRGLLHTCKLSQVRTRISDQRITSFSTSLVTRW